MTIFALTLTIAGFATTAHLLVGAEALVQSGDARGCAQALQAAIDGDTPQANQAPEAWLMLGQCHFLQRETDRAAYALRRALALDPKLVVAEDSAFDPWIPVFAAAQRQVVAGEPCAAATALAALAGTLLQAGDGALGAEIFAEARDLDAALALPALPPLDDETRATLAFERGPTRHSPDVVCSRGAAVARVSTLPAAPARILVKANVQDAEVFVDGYRAGRVGESIAVDPGTREITVVHPDYSRSVITIRQRSGQSAEASVILQPLTAHHH